MRAALVALVLALFVVGCGSESGGGADDGAAGERPPAADRTRRAAPERVALPPCPAEVDGCRRVRGRIVYVERVDPDGDGDAHFVIADRRGITLPGLTVIDVPVELRPDPLPGPGRLIAAAGPVQTGSYGQSQVHALAIAVGRPVGRR